jgi:hypothetical protein
MLMRVKLTDPILDYAGRPLKSRERPEDDETELTFRTAFAGALNNFARDEVPTAEMKARSFALTLKLFDTDEVELTTKEAALILERVNKVYPSPVICGRIDAILNPPAPTDAA